MKSEFYPVSAIPVEPGVRCYYAIIYRDGTERLEWQPVLGLALLGEYVQEGESQVWERQPYSTFSPILAARDSSGVETWEESYAESRQAEMLGLFTLAEGYPSEASPVFREAIETIKKRLKKEGAG